MELDLRGRIGNTKLPLSNGLFPLFEAISNSIHSIEEAKNLNGRIDIEIIRDTSQGSLVEGEPVLNQPIIGFVVHDNGVGFTDDNYKSFQTSDSTKKKIKGGKGVGRLLWLKAFEKAEIVSIFSDGNKRLRRAFEFTLSNNGVERSELAEVNGEPIKTTIRLVGFKAEYRKYQNCPKSASTLARRVVEHFLGMFILNGCPQILLHDNYEQTDIDLKDLFAREMRLDSAHQDFQIKKQTMRITHVRLLPPQDIGHSLFLCAVNRTVRKESLPKLLPNLETQLTDPNDGRRFLYVGCVSGKFLDANVNQERTRFDIPDENADGLFGDAITLQDIVEVSADKAKAFLEPYTKPLNEAKKGRIAAFVAKDAPQYRPILKHMPDRIESLRSNLSEEQLDVELYKIGQEWDLELRAEYKKLLSENDATASEQESFRQRYERFLAEWNESGISKLARYVVHRRATLAFLDERLKLKADGKYALEDAIHEIIFPLKATSEDVRVENMNLWILDEKLAYHYYLASDKPLEQVDVIEVDSKDRPDILIFNRPIAFAESGPPFSAIVIVEFKRPARDDYTEKEKKNPITQVYDYIDKLKEGKAIDKRGRPISIPAHLPIYAYIVCDLTPSLHKQARDYQLTKTPDSQGYFGYHRDHGAYIEIMSFDKLIADAQRRNKILFDKLGMEGEALGDL
ncbi:hypothetical protein BH11PLA2_BH11PLA2_16410 [soil metagenome]